eukprot:CAMPEP_0196770428 /NCGR_PEP_ID=MMETSP1104-20130614/1128_1 /TAXON_ID=33652 /ORGANISM="Cafeteria sp., Strain Caron Lab Isolate" /LENGTH=534 /DNA_ID=CAMNT_0042140541 /DNA_START=87 /DNA_END=1687 /DNA_ORIENTATION=+
MQELIPVINKLQDVFNAIGEAPIDLPQIVVIGSQSSGKSSVLESIVGRDFLPRGSGVVTRRPLVLQCYNIAEEATAEAEAKARSSEEGEEWGEFQHLSGQRIFNFDDIRREIEKETERVTGTNKGISSQEIHLRVYSPHVLNLTLVDLPGITKVPVGDQPTDIENQIRTMCLKYISNPNSIVLAVSAANTDLANSDALKLAREVDPEGMRTVGVLTKLDLMDQGTDALEMLLGRIIPLRRGFVGVINRSQKDIMAKLSIREALSKEEAFFKHHPAYRVMASRLGTRYLARMLNKMLMNHIRDTLPDIKARIQAMLHEFQSEMGSLGQPMSAVDRPSQGALLLALLSKFSANFVSAIEGRAAGSGEMLQELHGGARVAYIFSDVFTKSLMTIDPFDSLTDDEIRTAIRNATGPRASLFVPEISFEILVKRQIARLEQPGLQCADLVYDELHRLTNMCESAEMQRFPELRERVVDTVHVMLRERLRPTQEMITNLIRVELAHINTSHPDFIGGSRAVADIMERLSPQLHRDGAGAP